MNFWKKFSYIGMAAVILLALLFAFLDYATPTQNTGTGPSTSIPSKDSAMFSNVK